MTVFAIITRATSESESVDYGKQAYLYEYEIYNDEFDVYQYEEMPYVKYDGRKYLVIDTALSPYGEYHANPSRIEIGAPIANLYEGGLGNRLENFIFAFESEGTLYTTKSSGEYGVVIADSFYMDTEHFGIEPACDENDFGKLAARYTAFDYYDYYYCVLDGNAMDEAATKQSEYPEDDVLHHYGSMTFLAEIDNKVPLELSEDTAATLSEYFRAAVLPIVDTGGRPESPAGSKYADLSDERGLSEYREYHIFGISRDGLMVKEVAILVLHDGKLYQKESPPFDSNYDPFAYTKYSEELDDSGEDWDEPDEGGDWDEPDEGGDWDESEYYAENALYGYELPKDIQSELLKALS